MDRKSIVERMSLRDGDEQRIDADHLAGEVSRVMRKRDERQTLLESGRGADSSAPLSATGAS